MNTWKNSKKFWILCMIIGTLFSLLLAHFMKIADLVFLVYPDKYKCLSCGYWGRTSELLGKLDKTKARYT